MDLALVSLCWVRGEAQTCSLTDWRVGLNTDLQTPQWQCTGHSGDVIHIPPPVFSTVGERQKDQLWTDSTERWRTQDVLDTGADQWWRTDTGNYKPHRLVHAAKNPRKLYFGHSKGKVSSVVSFQTLTAGDVVCTRVYEREWRHFYLEHH